MRKILLIVAVLLIAAAPAMALVTVSAKHIGLPLKTGITCTACEVNYTCTAGEKVRAFALELNLTNGYTFTSIHDYSYGESNKAPSMTRGYGIFPGKFRDLIDAANPNYVDPNYNPIAPATDADAAGSGIGTGKIVVEMGSLYVPKGVLDACGYDVNGPCAVSVLFKFDIAGPGGLTTDINIVVNPTRGGVVLEDGTSLAVGPTTLVLSGHNGVGFPETFPCWQPYAAQYTEYLACFKPKCWNGTFLGAADVNWRTQCQGDADGKKQEIAAYRVFGSDYQKMLQAWGKKATQMRAGMGVDGNWMCADFDHKKQEIAAYRVFGSDYTKLLAGWGKKETQMRPWCPQ